MSYRRTCVIPLEPVRRVLNEWLARNRWDGDRGHNFHAKVVEGWGADRAVEKIVQPMSTWARLENETGLTADTLRNYALREGKKWIEFDQADKIITAIDPCLWRSDPELSAIYQNFDFASLDELSSCVAA